MSVPREELDGCMFIHVGQEPFCRYPITLSFLPATMEERTAKTWIPKSPRSEYISDALTPGSDLSFPFSFFPLFCAGGRGDLQGSGSEPNAERDGQQPSLSVKYVNNFSYFFLNKDRMR